jgi:hypothetical protein
MRRTAGTLQAAETSSVLTMKPLHGISLDVGTKRAVSYFLSKNALCKLTLMVGEAFTDDEVPADTATRFNVSIDPGKTAQAMSLTTVNQVAAYSPAAKRTASEIFILDP